MSTHPAGKAVVPAPIGACAFLVTLESRFHFRRLHLTCIVLCIDMASFVRTLAEREHEWRQLLTLTFHKRPTSRTFSMRLNTIDLRAAQAAWDSRDSNALDCTPELLAMWRALLVEQWRRARVARKVERQRARRAEQRKAQRAADMARGHQPAWTPAPGCIGTPRGRDEEMYCDVFWTQWKSENGSGCE